MIVEISNKKNKRDAVLRSVDSSTTSSLGCHSNDGRVLSGAWRKTWYFLGAIFGATAAVFRGKVDGN